MPAPKQDMSAQIVNETLTLLPPFTGLVFDQLLRQKNVTMPIHWLFDGMNPFFVSLFDHSDGLLPMIGMVFALSSAKFGVTIVEPERTTYCQKAKQKKVKKSSPYMSCDIWCAGAFAQTFTVINKAEEGVYKQLLKVCNPFPQSYKSALELPEEEALRSP